ncbi:MAG TPA: hypothetical protein VG326_05545 [Tepidisphaeraceae bacterium]|jgi:hypothetical protein|nr:hypothetical protein [Tepidisphaeraceae bacterium]
MWFSKALNSSAMVSARKSFAGKRPQFFEPLEARAYLSSANVSVTGVAVASSSPQIAGDQWTGGAITVTLTNMAASMASKTVGAISVALFLTPDSTVAKEQMDTAAPIPIGVGGSLAAGLPGAGGASTVSVQVNQTLTTVSNTYFILVDLTDQNMGDTVAAKTILAMPTVQINSKPDVSASFIGVPSTATVGLAFSSNPTIVLSNSGDTATEGAVTATIFLTTSNSPTQPTANLTPVDTVVFNPGVSSGAPGSMPISLGTVPSATGTYYVVTTLSDATPSDDDGLATPQTFVASQPITIGEQSTINFSVAVPTASEVAGEPTQDAVSVSLTNNGPSPTSAAVSLNLYLTQNAQATAPAQTDPQLAAGTAIVLPAGTMKDQGISEKVPLGQIPNVPAGTYFVIAVPTLGSPNDMASVVVSAGLMIAAAAPTLSASSSTSLSLIPGSPSGATVDVTIANTGNAAATASTAEPITVMLYSVTSSTPPQSTSGLPPLGTAQLTSGIDAGGSTSVAVPVSAASDAASGSFYVLAVVSSAQSQFSPQEAILAPTPSVSIGSISAVLAFKSNSLNGKFSIVFSSATSVSSQTQVSVFYSTALDGSNPQNNAVEAAPVLLKIAARRSKTVAMKLPQVPATPGNYYLVVAFSSLANPKTPTPNNVAPLFVTSPAQLLTTGMTAMTTGVTAAVLTKSAKVQATKAKPAAITIQFTNFGNFQYQFGTASGDLTAMAIVQDQKSKMSMQVSLTPTKASAIKAALLFKSARTTLKFTLGAIMAPGMYTLNSVSIAGVSEATGLTTIPANVVVTVT